MRLSRLLEASETSYALLQGSCAADIRSIAVDSRKVVPGSLFLALPGTKTHGFQFIGDAIKSGAKAILVPHEYSEKAKAIIPEDVALISVEDIKRVAGKVISSFFDEPSSKLEVIGITGTNGKTTCSYLIEAILKAYGKKTAVSGTICQRIGDHETTSVLTTPDCVSFHSFLKKALDAGAQYVITEVSSHALDQGRVEGCSFEVALFTNLTRDHLDYHKDLEDYFRAKSRLFTAEFSKRFVINLDDPYGKRLWERRAPFKLSYALDSENEAHVSVREFELNIGGIRAKIDVKGDILNIYSPLIGRHNLSNILAAIGVASALNIPLKAIKEGIESLQMIPGRLEPVGKGERTATALVDYAHTPDAVKSVLKALHEIKGSGRIITVIGCGGDRDKGKRPEMAHISAKYSDLSIFTSDNPRTENPSQILDQMLDGIDGDLLSKVRVIEDRKEAVYFACAQAETSDIILVAGKGHEDYQVVGNKKVPFDDRQVLKKGLEIAKLSHRKREIDGFHPIVRNIASVTKGQCQKRHQFIKFNSISTDSRAVKSGAMFWALRGERFDGNRFVSKALESGAVGAVCEVGRCDSEFGPVVQVEDTLFSLGEFASWYRRFLAMKTIGITGSCGKTTTKELVSSVVATAFRTGATKGNFNNLIGLPLTIFSMEPGTQWAVLEMGTNVPGEIERLCQIARPEIGIVTCIRPVHLEGLGSIENIAYEKGFLLQSLPVHGTAVVNFDDELILENLKRTRASIKWGFGFDAEKAEKAGIDHAVVVKAWRFTGEGLFVQFQVDGKDVEVQSKLFGKANVYNIAGAFAVGMGLGIDRKDIVRGIQACEPPSGRMNIEELSGWIIVDDSYNANPASMDAAIEYVKELKGAYGKNLVLGDMLELGEQTERFHLELGKKAASIDPSILVAVGKMSAIIAKGAIEQGLAESRILTFENAQEAASFLAQEEGTFFNGTKRVVLLKGSRGVRLEEVGNVIKQRLVEGK